MINCSLVCRDRLTPLNAIYEVGNNSTTKTSGLIDTNIQHKVLIKFRAHKRIIVIAKTKNRHRQCSVIVGQVTKLNN